MLEEVFFIFCDNDLISHLGWNCRIWALKDVAVHKSAVPEAECTKEKLEYNIANDIVGKFTGEGPAKALCCNWSLCNFNTSFAMLSGKK